MNKVPKIMKEKNISRNEMEGELTKKGLSRNTIKSLIDGVDKPFYPVTKQAVADILKVEVEEIFGKK